MTTIEQAYEKGWIAASEWANRADLVADIGSQAYVNDLRAALSAPATAPEQCWCDEQGIGEPGVSCGDCPTRDYKTTAPARPSWHDAPTSPGVWLSDRGYENPYRWGIYKVVDPDHEKGMTLEDERWFGPIPPDSGDKP